MTSRDCSTFGPMKTISVLSAGNASSSARPGDPVPYLNCIGFGQ